MHFSFCLADLGCCCGGPGVGASRGGAGTGGSLDFPVLFAVVAVVGSEPARAGADGG